MNIKKSNKLFLKTLNDLNKGFAYCELIIGDTGIPFGWIFLKVNPIFEKEFNRSIGSTIGKNNLEIFPDVAKSWINKVGIDIINKKNIHFSGLIHGTSKGFHACIFASEENRFTIVITSALEKIIPRVKGSLLNSKRSEIKAELIAVRKKIDFQKVEIEKKSKGLINALKGHKLEIEEKANIKSQKSKNNNDILALAAENKELQLENHRKEKDIFELVLEKEQAEKRDWLKTAFLTNVSHEIRTPLNGILGFSELLNNPLLSHEKRKEYIQIIENNGHKMLNSINSIINISKLETGLMKVNLNLLSANDLLESLESFLRSKAEFRGLNFFVKKGLPYIDSIFTVDQEKVFVILTNLVQNAIDFTEIGSIEIGYFQKGKHLNFYVKDSGIGIDKERHKAIFNRATKSGYSASESIESVGLSLSISKDLAKIIGGELRFESEKGKGSVFHLIIPYDTIKQSEDDDKSGLADVKYKRLKILIVEDDDTSALLLSEGFEGINQKMLYACNGAEAIEVCRENPDLDVILMDIKMPVINGYQATKEIRKFNKDVIIIAQTAHAFKDDKERAIESGCNDCVSKPIVMSRLIALIQKLC
ncbi:MAG: signal transduction histidine kinase [Flavobacteriales bacterium]|jgi:signal transduction histidine kinase